MINESSVPQPMDGKTVTLLLLPIKIRIKIYSYCGLIRPCPIDLNIESVRQRWSAHDLATRYMSGNNHCQYTMIRSTTGRAKFDLGLPPGLECFCPSLPHPLLRVSRAMHLEVETVLYGMNQFKVSRYLPGDNLKVLRALNPRVWSVLSSLNISLSEVPPAIPVIRKHECETIDIQGMAGWQTLQKWVAVCQDILSHVPAHWLRFSLSCNVKDVGTAREIVAPLSGLPPMAELSICLAADPKRREIQEVARDTISRLTLRELQIEPKKTAAPRSSSPGWTSLPQELRLDILSRTDLVDHFHLAKPSYHSHYYTNCRHGFEIKAGELLPRTKRCCYNCTPTLATCTCPPIHAAFSTSCTCALVPASVFSVSKAMSADATLIFFSRNSFILSGDFAANTHFVQCKLAHKVTAISCIRRLDLEISYWQLYDMQDPNSDAANNWATLVASVASLLPMPKLWLSIDAGGFRDSLESLNNDGHHDYSWIRTAYATLFAPLYVHLSKDRRPEKLHVFLCWFTEEEAKAEKEVMGGEYDSVAEGKVPWRVRLPAFPHSVEMSKFHTRFGGTNRA